VIFRRTELAFRTIWVNKKGGLTLARKKGGGDFRHFFVPMQASEGGYGDPLSSGRNETQAKRKSEMYRARTNKKQVSKSSFQM